MFSRQLVLLISNLRLLATGLGVHADLHLPLAPFEALLFMPACDAPTIAAIAFASSPADAVCLWPVRLLHCRAYAICLRPAEMMSSFTTDGQQSWDVSD